MKKVLSIVLCALMLFGFALTPVSSFAAEQRSNDDAVCARCLPFDLRSLFEELFARLFALQSRQAREKDEAPAGSPAEEKEEQTQEKEPEREDLPSADPAPERDPLPSEADRVTAFEKEVVALVNAERAKYGLKALTYSAKLSEGAREKSADMQRNRYFAHQSPTYGSPFDMMHRFGITYRAAGENIAMGYRTPEAVMNGWMNSPGHRANILSEKFTEIGVGYVEEGNYWTQWFRG